MFLKHKLPPVNTINLVQFSTCFTVSLIDKAIWSLQWKEKDWSQENHLLKTDVRCGEGFCPFKSFFVVQFPVNWAQNNGLTQRINDYTNKRGRSGNKQWFHWTGWVGAKDVSIWFCSVQQTDCHPWLSLSKQTLFTKEKTYKQRFFTVVKS